MRHVGWLVTVPAAVIAALGGASPAPMQFVDVTAASGVQFRHNSGRVGQKWLPETLGSGTAIFDADGDGSLDILFVNSRDWKPRGRQSLPTLYRNNGKGIFTDISRGSGLDVQLYALGVAVGDYDNDGRVDVYLTALEGDRLFHNEGGGRFRDVTLSAGIANASFGTSAAWLDFDRDGQLDLFVANYVQWTAAADLWCSLDGQTKSYCTPESYKTSSRLFRNMGQGAKRRFEDVTEKSGLGDPTSKSLGVTVLDYNVDGWPDLFVANDTQPNKLYRNKGNGTFAEEGVMAGVAYGEDGVARGAMGADAADYDRSGRPHLLVGNFSNQMLGLYHNDGRIFVDEAPTSTVGRASLLSLAFAVFFVDFDLDGYPDIFAANGHIEEEIGRVQPRVQIAKQPPLVFHNNAGKGFEDITRSLGTSFNRSIVARGAAHGDIDGDGDRDLVITTNDGPAYVYRNDGGNRNNWVTLRLIGTKSNRSAIGAVVRIQSASGTQWDVVRSGSSYCSQSDLAITFGLGHDARIARAIIDWPSGLRQEFTNLLPRQEYRIEEGRAIPLSLTGVPAPAVQSYGR